LAGDTGWLVLRGQTRLCVTHNAATEWDILRIRWLHRVRCACDLVLSHKTLEPAEVPVRQPALP